MFYLAVFAQNHETIQNAEHIPDDVKQNYVMQQDGAKSERAARESNFSN